MLLAQAESLTLARIVVTPPSDFSAFWRDQLSECIAKIEAVLDDSTFISGQRAIVLPAEISSGVLAFLRRFLQSGSCGYIISYMRIRKGGEWEFIICRPE